MTLRNPPPNQSPVVDNNGLITLQWAEFMDGIYKGDAGRTWTPDVVGLTSTGTPTITGRFYRESSYLLIFRITIVPATDTTSVSGSTYVQSLPFTIVSDAPCFATVPPVSIMGACVSSNNRIYLPDWSGITVPVTINGRIEGQ